MRSHLALLAAGLVALGALAACSSGAGGGELSAGGASAPSRPVIGKLQTHDRSVTLMASPGGLRVTVEDASGAVLAQDVEVEGLRTVDPLTYELCRSSVASTGAPFLDARVVPASAAPAAALTGHAAVPQAELDR